VAGTLIVARDASLIVASAFVLCFLAKVLETGQGAWWLAVGVAVGLALLSKYTALFFGVSILLWLALVPNLRRWLLTPWPYLGGLAAFAVFSPVIFWNAQHGWVSLIKQLGRARGDDFTLRYLFELIPVQIGLATPPVFVLGAAGLIAMAYGRGGSRPVRVLLGAMAWPLFVYFLWHSLHARVEGNWLGLGEISMVLACSWALFASLNDRSTGSSPRFATGANGLRIARYLFAIAVLPVGLSHFMYAPQTVALVPAWLPYRLGWAYLGGVGHMAAGLGVLFGVLPELAATLEAAMIGMFTLLVWLPGVVAAPGNRLQWTAFTISYTVAAAAWVVAASLSRAS
jgi:uncharacterized membrane protein